MATAMIRLTDKEDGGIRMDIDFDGEKSPESSDAHFMMQHLSDYMLAESERFNAQHAETAPSLILLPGVRNGV